MISPVVEDTSNHYPIVSYEIYKIIKYEYIVFVVNLSGRVASSIG